MASTKGDAVIKVPHIRQRFTVGQLRRIHPRQLFDMANGRLSPKKLEKACRAHELGMWPYRGTILPGHKLFEIDVWALWTHGVFTERQLRQRSMWWIHNELRRTNPRTPLRIFQYCDERELRLSGHAQPRGDQSYADFYRKDLVNILRPRMKRHVLWRRFPDLVGLFHTCGLCDPCDIESAIAVHADGTWIERRKVAVPDRKALLYVLWKLGIPLDDVPIADPIGKLTQGSRRTHSYRSRRRRAAR